MSEKKKRVISFSLLASMVLAMIVVFSFNDPRSASAEHAPAQVQCHYQKNPPALICVQEGIPIVTELIDLPTQTVTLPLPTPTINIPDIPTVVVTRTKTVTLPAETHTIRVPGSVVTETATRTVRPEPRPTVTVTRQPRQNDGTLVPEPVDEGLLSPTQEKILSVTAIVLAAAIAGILMLWLGFVLGYRSADRDNKRFWSALKEQIFQNRK